MKLLYCRFTCSLNLKVQCVLSSMFCHKFNFSDKIIMDVESPGYKKINQIFNALTSTLCVCVCALVCVHACMCACVCMYACVCVCACVRASIFLKSTGTDMHHRYLLGGAPLSSVSCRTFMVIKALLSHCLCVESSAPASPFLQNISSSVCFFSHTHAHTHAQHTPKQ